MKKILLTEGDAALAYLFRDRFREADFEMAVVSESDELIAELENNPPDIVLIDLLLPGINGVELIKFIRAHPSLPDLPVIVLSNLNHFSGLVQAALQAGANDFLNKADSTPTTVLEQVRRILDNTKPASQDEPPKAPAVASPIKVLLADDDSTIHSIMEFHLSRAGIEMKSVYNGQDALEAADLDPPDLLVLDVMMPGLDGFKVLQKWHQRESLRGIPVIMLTVWGEDEDKLTAIQNGADAYFTKPFSPAELINKVRFLTQEKA